MASEIWQQIINEIKRISPDIYKTVNQPAKITQIRELETVLDCALPQSFVDYLLVFNGQSEQGNEFPLFGFTRFLPVDEIIKTIEQQIELFGDEEPLEHIKENRIKPVLWNKRWLPFAEFNGDERLILDLDAGKNGKNGQIIHLWSGIDMEDDELLLANSFDEFDNVFLDHLKNNDFKIENGIMSFSFPLQSSAESDARWEQIGRPIMTKTHLELHEPSNLSCLQESKELEYLFISGGKNIGKDICFETIGKLNNLKTLLLEFITIDNLNFIINTKIDYLMLAMCRLKCDLSVLGQSNIQTLALSQNHNLTDLHFIEKISTLKKLKIDQSKATKLFDFSNLTHLEELHLQCMKSLESIECLSSAKSLKTLYIEEINTKLKAKDFEVLLNLPNLENLYVDFLDFGKKRIKEVKEIFISAGKSQILKEGLIGLHPQNHPRL
ncbi:hypothetical protein FACS189487_08930 [Campylobacterota bacterium]|nr:hypothetical protein FACS189487_08930 [Campylobacterota bacterium]